MSENEDVLLEFFVSLPQLKQITSDKEELVTNIVDMASKFLFCPWTEGLGPGLDGHYNFSWSLQRYVHLCLSFTEKNLQMEPQLEGKRQEMLYKVRYDILLCSLPPSPFQTDTLTYSA